jgi:hypothetical protein
MLTLLRDLRRLRRTVALPRPTAEEHGDPSSTRARARVRHELTLMSARTTTCSASASGWSRSTARRRPRDGAVTTRMRVPLLTAYARCRSRARGGPRRLRLGRVASSAPPPRSRPVDALLPVDLRVPGAPDARGHRYCAPRLVDRARVR